MRADRAAARNGVEFMIDIVPGGSDSFRFPAQPGYFTLPPQSLRCQPSCGVHHQWWSVFVPL